MIVCFVDIGGIVDNYQLSFLLTKTNVFFIVSRFQLKWISFKWVYILYIVHVDMLFTYYTLYTWICWLLLTHTLYTWTCCLLQTHTLYTWTCCLLQTHTLYTWTCCLLQTHIIIIHLWKIEDNTRTPLAHIGLIVHTYIFCHFGI